ncbi:uncharacterized protein [Porites lutea]|uniref:uncharacterized protein n=1 Tax=Porites lutea TaxID=51062 RepID=UPI003CC6775C
MFNLLKFTLCSAIFFLSVSCTPRKATIKYEESPRQMFLRLKPADYKRFLDAKSENDQLSEIKCGLYSEVVQVEPNVTDLRNYPQFLQVNRCRGSCDRALILKACEPTQIRNIRVTVRSQSGKSYPVEVQDHEKCMCNCQVECNDKIHDYNDNLCKCECRKKCPDGKMQDPSTCECNGQTRKELSRLTEY